MTIAANPSDEQLIEYLLGALPPADEDRFDEQSIADDQFAARLTAVENDLIDAYVNGELSGERLTRFRAHYLRSRSGIEKVQFAEALSHRGQATVSPKTRLFDWRLAAAAVLVLAAGGFVLVENNRLRNELADLRTRSAPLDQPAPPQPPPSADQKPVIAAFLLMPATRGPGGLPSLTLRRGTEAVAIVLAEVEDFPTYEAALKDLISTQTIWRQANLTIVSGGTARSLLVTIPATALKSGTYAIELTGIPRTGTPEVINSYPFKLEN